MCALLRKRGNRHRLTLDPQPRQKKKEMNKKGNRPIEAEQKKIRVNTNEARICTRKRQALAHAHALAHTLARNRKRTLQLL